MARKAKAAAKTPDAGRSEKYELVKKYHDDGRWKPFMVKNAVEKGWITAEEYEEITGEAP
ncbi:MAG: XkdX family protein [Bacteroidales bacterium]|nr:XkdX family protein [Bacteroidales bacterium]